jgi:hypothetical protein
MALWCMVRGQVYGIRSVCVILATQDGRVSERRQHTCFVLTGKKHSYNKINTLGCMLLLRDVAGTWIPVYFSRMIQVRLASKEIVQCIR